MDKKLILPICIIYKYIYIYFFWLRVGGARPRGALWASRHWIKIFIIFPIMEVIRPSYLSIREEEHHVLALHARHLVEPPQVLVEAVVVVSSAQFDLEAAVAAHVGRQASERLLAGTAHPDQQGVASLLANHTGNPRRSEEVVVCRQKVGMLCSVYCKDIYR